MNYIKKLLISSKEIIITYLLEYIILIISCLIYYILINKELTTFINNNLSYISIISLIIITTYIYNKNKIKESNINYKLLFPVISIGISISCFLNMIIFKIYPPINNVNNISFILIISSGLLGPIYEEILFRYINLNKLKEFNTPIKSILINSLIFALIHFNIKEIIFAFFLSLTINYIYHKKNNIIYPIIIHQSANIISLFLSSYNRTILILSIICFLINIEIIKEFN